MVAGVLFHFILVELRPVIAAGISTLTICGNMFKQAYNSQVDCICQPGCSYQQTIAHNSRLLQRAMISFSPTWNGTTECTRVGVGASDKWKVSLFFFSLAGTWILVLVACITMFLVEACKQRFSSVRSGAYLVFTLQLEHRCVYRVIARAYTLAWVLVFIAGVAMILHQSKWNYGLVWNILWNELIPWIVLLSSSQKLLSPANMKEFSSWDLEKMRQIRFRRSSCSVLFDSNDDLYHRIGVATMEAARGNYKDLRALVLREDDVRGLMEAIDLPSLIPDQLEAGAQRSKGRSKTGENEASDEANTISL